MIKNVISITCLLLISLSHAFADKSQYIDLNKFLNPDADSYNDIAYLHVIPQYEEVPDPNKAVAIEFFFGEYDDSPESHRRLEHIREIIEIDKKRDPNFKSEVIGISTNTDNIKHSKGFQNFLTTLHFQDSKIRYDEVPKFLDYSAKAKEKPKSKRLPSSFKFEGGKKFWTAVRFSTGFGGTYLSMYYMQGLSAGLATSLAIYPGLASGAFMYYNGPFGSFLNNGSWSTWLLESDTYFAKKMRNTFKLNKVTFEDALIKNKEYFKVKFPTLFEKNSTLFDKEVLRKSRADTTRSKEKLTRILSRLLPAESYFKWWVTEIIFTASAIKLPLILHGVSEFGGVGSFAFDVLKGSSMGMLAQGPGDIAIHLRKYQMIDELKASVKSGKVQVDNQKALLDEIEKVLAKSGKYKNYVISDISHKALQKIENWARSRSSFLSFFAITGVSLEVLGIPLARPLLISVGLGGALYYSKVKGWINTEKLTSAVKNFIARFKNGEVKFSMLPLQARFCASKYMMKPN